MKTLLITGSGEALPDAVRDVITRGSTSVVERRAAEVQPDAAMPDANRIVFWSGGDDAGVNQLARRYAAAERAERREAIVFVTTAAAPDVPGLSNTELYLWPQDRDRLEMAFLTGA